MRSFILKFDVGEEPKIKFLIGFNGEYISSLTNKNCSSTLVGGVEEMVLNTVPLHRVLL
jgi:hypothetical protein